MDAGADALLTCSAAPERIGPDALRLRPVLTYHGPLADCAHRLLSGACAHHPPLRFIPGLPIGEGDNATVVVAEKAERASLTIDPEGIRIRANTPEMVRACLVDLAQLIRRFGAELPAISIPQEPALATRGVMLDVSRCRVPTMSQLYSVVDQLELLKINHLQLYMEHTFAYEGHEAVWSEASAFTPEEINELDSYCHARGVELCANQNTLGHLERWFAHDRYLELAEIPDRQRAWSFQTPDGREIVKRGPFSLCPTDERSLELVRDMLDQLLPCFSSTHANVGCDEAYDVGQGRSKDEVSERGAWEVYASHVRAVDAIVRDHGKQTLLWGDLAVRHSQTELSGTALLWGYEPGSVFDCEALPGSWACPGTSSWLSITGRTSVSSENTQNAARSAAPQRGAMLVCDWGDQGHRQHWPVSLLAIARAAHHAWCGPEARFDARSAALHLFDDGSLASGPWLERLGDADADLSRRAGLSNTNALYTELHRRLDDPAEPGSLDDWQAIRNRLASMRSEMDGFAPGLHPLVRDELDHTLRVAEHAGDKAIVCRAEASGLPRAPARIRLAADMGAIIEDHESLWHARSRPGGLEESTSWYERVFDDYQHPERVA